MAKISVNFHLEENSIARCNHQDDAAVLGIETMGAYGRMSIFGPSTAKDAFDKIAQLLNSAIDEGKSK